MLAEFLNTTWGYNKGRVLHSACFHSAQCLFIRLVQEHEIWGSLRGDKAHSRVPTHRASSFQPLIFEVLEKGEGVLAGDLSFHVDPILSNSPFVWGHVQGHIVGRCQSSPENSVCHRVASGIFGCVDGRQIGLNQSLEWFVSALASACQGQGITLCIHLDIWAVCVLNKSIQLLLACCRTDSFFD